MVPWRRMSTPLVSKVHISHKFPNPLGYFPTAFKDNPSPRDAPKPSQAHRDVHRSVIDSDARAISADMMTT